MKSLAEVPKGGHPTADPLQCHGSYQLHVSASRDVRWPWMPNARAERCFGASNAAILIASFYSRDLISSRYMPKFRSRRQVSTSSRRRALRQHMVEALHFYQFWAVLMARTGRIRHPHSDIHHVKDMTTCHVAIRGTCPHDRHMILPSIRYLSSAEQRKGGTMADRYDDNRKIISKSRATLQ
jgi:hypothetical protein